MKADHIIESTVRALMFLAGMLGNNWLAVRSIPARLSSLRTNELLFLNLAVSNLITNYLVDLPDTMSDFAGGWFLGVGYCGVFRFCADLSETSSIFSTLFISVYWHQKLVGSLKRGGGPVQLDSLRLVGCLLAGSWGMAIVFSIPHYFFIKVEVEGENGSSLKCNDMFPSEQAQLTYEVLYLTLANALPVAGIMYASAQIVVTLMQSQKRIQGHGGNHASSEEGNPAPGPTANTKADGGGGGEARAGKPAAKPSPGSSNQVRAAKSVVAVASIFVVCWVTHLLLRISSNIQTSPVVVEVASYIASSYTSIIPYIFLYGVKKLSCSCRGAPQ
ncbi:unnamed protein product [Lota lota]